MKIKNISLAALLGAITMALMGGGIAAAYAVAEDNVTICHLEPDGGGGAQLIEMIIPESSLSAHLAHGDTLGPCFESTTITVTESGTTETITTPATTVTVTTPTEPQGDPPDPVTVTQTVTSGTQTVTTPGGTETVIVQQQAAPVTVAGPAQTVTNMQTVTQPAVTVAAPVRTVTVTKQRIIVKTKPCTCPKNLVPVWKKNKWMGCAARGKG